MWKENSSGHVGGGFDETPSYDSDSLSDYDNVTNDIDSNNEESESKRNLKNNLGSCLSKTFLPTSTMMSNSSTTQLSCVSSSENGSEERNCKYTGQTIAKILHTKQRIRHLLRSSRDGGREISISGSEISSHSKTKPTAKPLYNSLKSSSKSEKTKVAPTDSLMIPSVGTDKISKKGLHRTKSDAGFLRLPTSRQSAISGNGEASIFERSKRRSWMSNSLDMRQKKKDAIQGPQMLAYRTINRQNITKSPCKAESPKLSLNLNNNNSQDLWHSEALNLNTRIQVNTKASECLGVYGKKDVLKNTSSLPASKRVGSFTFIRHWSKRSSFRRKKEERKSLPLEAMMHVKVQDNDQSTLSFCKNEVILHSNSKASKIAIPPLSTTRSQMSKDLNARPLSTPNKGICNHKPKVAEKSKKKSKAKQRFLAKFIFKSSERKKKSSINNSLSF